MASVRKVDGKKGTSYIITVSKGRDSKNHQIRHFTTWKPSPGMTDRQIEKELERVKVTFETQLDQGYKPDDRQTVEEYAVYFLSIKEGSGTKHSTMVLWKGLLKRILPEIGTIRLHDVRPKHLNDLYSSLRKSGVRKAGIKATAKDGLRDEVLKKYSVMDFLGKCGLASATLTKAFRQETISYNTAEKIAEALEKPVESLFLISTNSKPLNSKTIMQYHRFLSSMLECAVDEMLIPYNPASKAKPPKITDKEIEILEVGDIDKLLTALEAEPMKWRTITHLLMITGARRGEILGLKWPMVSFEKKCIHIVQSLQYTAERGVYTDTLKTKKSKRTIYLPVETMNMLDEYSKWQLEIKTISGDRWQDTDYVFTQDNGQPMHPQSITSWLNEFAKRKGLPHIHPHKLRHTHASQLLYNGENVVTVSERLGHGRISTTQDFYAHTLEDADKRAAETAANIFLR